MTAYVAAFAPIVEKFSLRRTVRDISIAPTVITL
jgi:hypothetical protein